MKIRNEEESGRLGIEKNLQNCEWERILKIVNGKES